ncbi:DUF397 domain-containing protein [Streptosporangium canum]
MAADLTGATWRKCSLGGSSGGNCVEVAAVDAAGFPGQRERTCSR